MPSALRRAAVLAAVITVPVASLLTTLTITAGSASAATSAGCSGGAFTVTMPGGAVVKPNSAAKMSSSSLTADSRVTLRGRYVEFDFAPVTGNIYNYVYTGAANPKSMTGGVRTPVFASKTVGLGAVLTKDVEARPDGTDLTILSRGGSAKVKIQAKDCATGGIFQQEVESEAAAKPVVFTHTLAPGMAYFVNPYTQKVNFGDGRLFRGKDSPQVATRLSQTAEVAVW